MAQRVFDLLAESVDQLVVQQDAARVGDARATREMLVDQRIELIVVEQQGHLAEPDGFQPEDLRTDPAAIEAAAGAARRDGIEPALPEPTLAVQAVSGDGGQVVVPVGLQWLRLVGKLGSEQIEHVGQHGVRLLLTQVVKQALESDLPRERVVPQLVDVDRQGPALTAETLHQIAPEEQVVIAEWQVRAQQGDRLESPRDFARPIGGTVVEEDEMMEAELEVMFDEGTDPRFPIANDAQDDGVARREAPFRGAVDWNDVGVDAPQVRGPRQLPQRQQMAGLHDLSQGAVERHRVWRRNLRVGTEAAGPVIVAEWTLAEHARGVRPLGDHGAPASIGDMVRDGENASGAGSGPALGEPYPLSPEVADALRRRGLRIGGCPFERSWNLRDLATCARDPRALRDYLALLRLERQATDRSRSVAPDDQIARSPRVAAVVLSWRREPNLPRVVRGLERQSFVDRVIVVHNHPSRLRVPGCINLYSATNRGCGIRHEVAHDLVGWDAYLFVDDDLVLDEDAASTLLPALKAHGDTSVIGFFGQTLNSESCGRAYSMGSGGCAATGELPVDVVKGRAHLLSRACVERLAASSMRSPSLDAEDDIRVSLALQQDTGRSSILVPPPAMTELAEPQARWRRSGHLRDRDRAVVDATEHGWKPQGPAVVLQRSLGRRARWSKDLLGLRLCAEEPEMVLRCRFERILRDLPISNVFNPSFVVGEGTTVFGFRAIREGQEELCSFLSVEGERGIETLNLSEETVDLVDGPRIIDPKLFRLEDGIYATFNTGWDPPRNQIYVMKVHPELGEPKRVTWDGRRGQERNWAFFEEDGEIFALYWLDPLIVLRLRDRNASVWEFVEHERETKSGGRRKGLSGLTIGTPLAEVDGRYVFVAHRKIRVPRRKLYVGRLMSLDVREGSVQPLGPWLTHSLSSLLGSRTKHNTNLFSCTYFSGIQAVPGGVQLGYGVNDVDWGFASIPFGIRSDRCVLTAPSS